MGAKNSASLRADRCHAFFVLQPLTPGSWLLDFELGRNR